MQVKSIHIKNFRAFEDVTVDLNTYTCFVGANGAGKSTVLCALNIFFGETANAATDLVHLQEEDFHCRNTSQPIEITVTFGDLSPAAQEVFRDYYRQEKLVVSAIAEFDPVTEQATVRQFGQRLGLKAFAPFFEAMGNGAQVAELKLVYAQIRTAHPSLPAPGTKAAMVDALHEYEAQHLGDCELLKSEDQFYGVSKGANRMEKYIQWVFVPAVKDASSEEAEGKATALGKLLARTIRQTAVFSDDIRQLQQRMEEEYTQILDRCQDKLDDLSESLGNRLAQWSHPDTRVRVRWSGEGNKSVRVEEPFARICAGEGAFEGRLARFGHGLQRCYLLALLQELADIGGDEGPKLLLALEEPELFQHPPQARHLAEVLKELAAQGNQVMVCTHSPYFVSGDHFEDIRLVCKKRNDACAHVRSVTNAQIAARLSEVNAVMIPENGAIAQIYEALQPGLNEMFFSPVIVLVEGAEDVAHITAYLHLLELWGEWRRLGCHLVPTNGKSKMIKPLAVAQMLSIPTFVVFDSDADQADNGSGRRARHEKDNKALLTLAGGDPSQAMPADTYWTENLVMWKSEIGTIVKDAFGDQWSVVDNEARTRNGSIKDLEKNALCVADRLQIGWDKGLRCVELEKLCHAIIAFAGKAPHESDDKLEAAANSVAIAREDSGVLAK